MQTSLFENGNERQDATAPLADRMRPRTMEEFIGQEHILGKGKLLRRAVEADRLTSSIFWGPPGCGKTTLAYVIANSTNAHFEKMNAVTSGVADMRKVIQEARERRRTQGRETMLLLDECHRWSKAQSDSILPAMESGDIRFIGSTTENPMVSMTPAIVSRCRLFHFEPLDTQDITRGLQMALADERGLKNMHVSADEDALEYIARTATGDMRSALGALEIAALTTPVSAEGDIHIDIEVAQESIQQRVLAVDESLFYDMLSAFCKSLRGSDSDAALAWFGRLVYAGIDPRIIARRLIVHASEDVGMANPQAMLLAAAAMQAVQNVGMPEAGQPLAQAIIAVCESPKSNSVSQAWGALNADVANARLESVPVHLRDTHYKGAERLGHGEGYKYPHDYPGHYVKQDYMPVGSEGQVYYVPSDQGFEKEIRKLRKEREQYGETI